MIFSGFETISSDMDQVMANFAISGQIFLFCLGILFVIRKDGAVYIKLE
jgi:hypothetical protein